MGESIRAIGGLDRPQGCDLDTLYGRPLLYVLARQARIRLRHVPVCAGRAQRVGRDHAKWRASQGGHRLFWLPITFRVGRCLQ